MIYSKKFKIILISVIIIFVIGLISLALINRSIKINQLNAVAESTSIEDLESEETYAELISATSITTDIDTDTEDNSSDTINLKSKIELPDYFLDISDEQIEKNEETLNLLIGSWSSNQSNIPVECTFTENTMTIHYLGDEYIKETTLVYNFEILDDTNMLIEDNGVVTKESYKLYNVGDKLYFESPIKKYTSIYIKDDFVYTTTETTTEETSTETTTKKETSTKQIEETTEEDDIDELEKIIKQYERFIETTTEEDILETTTEEEEEEDVLEEEIIEEEEIETTTAKISSGITFDEWLLNYLNET